MANQSVDPTTGCCVALGGMNLDEATAVELSSGFGALADPVRLRLLALIAAAGEEGVCVCDLIEPSGRSQPTVSHHLKVLRSAGLVTSERRGRWVWYVAERKRLGALRSALS